MYYQHSLLFVLVFISHVSARSNYLRCFQRIERRSIDNSQPLTEIFYVSPYQCIDQCILLTNNAKQGDLCKSFVYNHFQHSCRLYSHDGSEIPAIVHPANGYDYFRRTAVTRECAGPIQRFYDSRANTIPPVGTEPPPTAHEKSIPSSDLLPFADSKAQFVKIKTESNPLLAEQFARRAKSGGRIAAPEGAIAIGDQEEVRRPVPSKFRIRPGSSAGLPAGTNKLAAVPNTAVDLGYVAPEEGSDSSPSSSRVPNPRGTTRIPDVVQPHSKSRKDGCPTSTAYYVVIGNEIVLPVTGSENDVRVYKGIEQSFCAQYCSSGTGPNGETIKCSSMNYFPGDEKCEIYNILAEPHGPGSLVENDNVIYAEKFCLPESEQRCGEDEIFILHVQKKVASSPVKTVSSNSITSCLQSCLNNRGCQSASFDSTKRRCSLHSTNIGDSPNAVTETDPGWVLIENGCVTTHKKHKLFGTSQKSSEDAVDTTAIVSEWSEWSSCRYKIAGDTIRVRRRQCRENCGDDGMQIEKC